MLELSSTFVIHFICDLLPIIGGFALFYRSYTVTKVLWAQAYSYTLFPLRIFVFWFFSFWWILFSFCGLPFGIFALHGSIVCLFGRSFYGLEGILTGKRRKSVKVVKVIPLSE